VCNNLLPNTLSCKNTPVDLSTGVFTLVEQGGSNPRPSECHAGKEQPRGVMMMHYIMLPEEMGPAKGVVCVIMCYGMASLLSRNAARMLHDFCGDD